MHQIVSRKRNCVFLSVYSFRLVRGCLHLPELLVAFACAENSREWDLQSGGGSKLRLRSWSWWQSLPSHEKTVLRLAALCLQTGGFASCVAASEMHVLLVVLLVGWQTEQNTNGLRLCKACRGATRIMQTRIQASCHVAVLSHNIGALRPACLAACMLPGMCCHGWSLTAWPPTQRLSLQPSCSKAAEAL